MIDRQVKLPEANYGPAITEIWEDEEGRLWVGNGEYSSQVYFDPVTGEKAKNQTDSTVDQYADFQIGSEKYKRDRLMT